MKVVAILDRSAGNETVGEMWKETKVFDADTPVYAIMKWANDRVFVEGNVRNFNRNLTLTVAQED